ncbi:MAG: hypothetical protein QM642_11320 [Edaphocola sp.]
MNKYVKVLVGAFCLLPAMANAQNEIDALRYGQTSSAATARLLSLGGAGGSLGGDFSSIAINPAAIGVYRSSEIMITPSLRFNSVKSTYLGSQHTDDNTKMTLNNFGVVFSTAKKGRSYEKSGWKAFSVGIGYNRIADFNSKGYYAGNNAYSSITEAWAADAKVNGTSDGMVPPYGFFAYEGYLTDDSLNSIPYNNIIKNGGSLNQTKTWNTSGGINEWNLSLGGNYMEKLMLGGGISLTSYKYTRNAKYSEEDATGNTDNDFSYLDYSEYLHTTGVGINLKLGAIYVVNDHFRVGASIHSPTWSAYSDVSDYLLETNTEGFKASLGGNDQNSVTSIQPGTGYQFDYSLRSPWRGTVSATAFLGKNGFITADYEYAAINSMKYSFDDADYTYEHQVNQAIKDTYKGTHALRVGMEGRLQNYMARIGIAYYTSPFRQNDIFDGQRMDVSAGLGARFGNFFADLAYVHVVQKSGEYGYPLLVASNSALGIRSIPVGIANLNYGNNQVALTVGFKF